MPAAAAGPAGSTALTVIGRLSGRRSNPTFAGEQSNVGRMANRWLCGNGLDETSTSVPAALMGGPDAGKQNTRTRPVGVVSEKCPAASVNAWRDSSGGDMP